MQRNTFITTLLYAALAPVALAKTNSPMARATVVAVDPDRLRVLLRHGPIRSLHMGAMTMEFALQDARMLKGLKKGSQLRFEAVQQGDDYLITKLRVLK